MKKHILIICPYPENEVPGQRLKYEQYLEYFRSNGYRITVTPFFGKFYYKILYTPGNYHIKIIGTLWGYIKRIFQILRLPFYDGIYIFLYVTPFGGSFFERLYRLFSRRMIYDIDDLVFLGKASKFNPMVAYFRQPEKYFFLMRESDHVITCTPYLDSIVRKYNSRTTDISSTINTDKYTPIENYSNDHKLILGYSGSHSTIPYLRLLEPVLLKLKKEYDFKLLVIGSTSSFKIEGIDVEAIPWNESTEVDDLRRIDIGLYPLPDEEWVLGKSGLKALQYMALGIPTLATAIGTNFRIMENDVSGFLVDSEDEWLIQLRNLLSDSDLRSRIGKNGRDHVQKHYSVRANEDVYLSIFKDVFNNNEVTIAEPIISGLDQLPIKFLPISVIIPSFNYMESLKEVLNAIDMQEARPNEVVIIDSSNNNDIEKMLSNFKCSINIVYKKVSKAFPGEARNLGFTNSSEDWIAFLDSKTIPKPDWLLNSYKKTLSNNIDVIFGCTKYIAKTNSQLLLKAAVYGDFGVETTPGTLISRKNFIKIGGFVEGVRTADDIEWRDRIKKSNLIYKNSELPNLTYSEISESLFENTKRFFNYQMYGGLVNTQSFIKSLYLSLFLIFTALIIPNWNHMVGWEKSVFFIPNITKIYLILLTVTLISIRFITNKVRETFVIPIRIGILILMTIIVMYWNEVIASWNENGLFYIPHITKIYIITLVLLSIIYRGIYFPITNGINKKYLFPFKWINVGVYGLLLDIIKAPGYIIGAIIHLFRSKH